MGWATLVLLGACAGTPEIDWTGYTSIVVPPIETTITDGMRVDAQEFAVALRMALIRSIEAGNKIAVLKEARAAGPSTARLQVTLVEFNRQGESVTIRMSWSVTDARDVAEIHETTDREGTNRPKGDGANPIPAAADVLAQVLCGRLGLGSVDSTR